MSYPAGASLQLVPNSKFIIHNSKYPRWRKLAACTHTLRYTLWQTFRVCQSFLYPNSKSIIQNSQLPQLHCKIFAKVGKIPPPIVKIMLNFTIHNVKFLFLVISLIHQLTTAKDERRMSEG